MDQATREARLARSYALWAAATNFRRYEKDPSVNKSRLAARLKADAVDKSYALALIAVFFGVFAGLDALFGHSRNMIPFATALLCAYGAASITHTLTSDAYNTLATRLRKAIPAAAGTEGTDTEAAR